MGYMTVISILNDAWETLQDNKEEFFEKIELGMRGKHPYKKYRSVNSYSVGNHCNPIEVTRSFHADMSQLYLVGQNCMCDLLNTTGLSERDILFLIDSQKNAESILEMGEENVCDFVIEQIRALIKEDTTNEEIKELIKNNTIIKSKPKYFSAKKIKYIEKKLLK